MQSGVGISHKFRQKYYLLESITIYFDKNVNLVEKYLLIKLNDATKLLINSHAFKKLYFFLHFTIIFNAIRLIYICDNVSNNGVEGKLFLY